MRPALSTSFCFPVKKGWHWEQISTRISFFVERVLKVFPQAHDDDGFLVFGMDVFLHRRSPQKRYYSKFQVPPQKDGISADFFSKAAQSTEKRGPF